MTSIYGLLKSTAPPIIWQFPIAWRIYIWFSQYTNAYIFSSHGYSRKCLWISRTFTPSQCIRGSSLGFSYRRVRDDGMWECGALGGCISRGRQVVHFRSRRKGHCAGYHGTQLTDMGCRLILLCINGPSLYVFSMFSKDSGVVLVILHFGAKCGPM